MRSRLVVLCAAVLATGVIAAGCGGDDEESTSSDSGSDDFVAQVTAVCDDAAADFVGLQTGLQEAVLSGEKASFETFISDQLAPLFDSLISDLDAIEPPEDQAADYDTLIGNLQESSDLITDDPGAIIEASTDPNSEVATQIEELGTESDQLATELGIPDDCGETTDGAATGAESATP